MGSQQERQADPGGTVLGVDGTRDGWLCVALRDGVFAGAVLAPDFAAVLARFESAAVIAVDIPIGLPEHGPRQADLLARQKLGPRRSSVFPVPVRQALEAATYPEALALCRALGCPGLSKQAYALREKVLQVDRLVPARPLVVEVHPEVSFQELNGGTPLECSKKSWNGLGERLALLKRAGIVLPPRIREIGNAPADDLVDAAVAAWTASRVAHGTAGSLPERPPHDSRGRPLAIRY